MITPLQIRSINLDWKLSSTKNTGQLIGAYLRKGLTPQLKSPLESEITAGWLYLRVNTQLYKISSQSRMPLQVTVSKNNHRFQESPLSHNLTLITHRSRALQIIFNTPQWRILSVTRALKIPSSNMIHRLVTITQETLSSRPSRCPLPVWERRFPQQLRKLFRPRRLWRRCIWKVDRPT